MTTVDGRLASDENVARAGRVMLANSRAASCRGSRLGEGGRVNLDEQRARPGEGPADRQRLPGPAVLLKRVLVAEQAVQPGRGERQERREQDLEGVDQVEQ